MKKSTKIYQIIIDGLKFFFKKTDKNNSIDFIFSNSCMKIQQSREEFEKLIQIYKKLNPKLMMEIGTYKGGSLYIFSRQIKKLHMIGIDYPSEWTKFKKIKTILKFLIVKSIPQKNQKLNLIIGNSHNTETLKKVKKILNGKQLDFLHIDADHSYEGIKKDFELYFDLVRKGGIIAFHDVYSIQGVKKFWDEIKSKYKSEEILSKNIDKRPGIGIIYKQ